VGAEHWLSFKNGGRR